MWPLIDGGSYETIGADTSDSAGTTITGSATANTKGTWVELVASTANDASGISIFTGNGTLIVLTNALVDIGIGAESSEIVIIPNLLPRALASIANSFPDEWFFPIHIPAGTRISARMQASSSSVPMDVVCILSSRTTWMAPSIFSRVTTYGADTSDSGGTQIDPGATANAKGAWAQITASSTNDIKLLTFDLATSNKQIVLGSHFLFDIGIGVASFEIVLIENIFVTNNGHTNNPPHSISIPKPLSIPSGTRIAVRSQSDSTVTNDRLIDIIIHGVD